MSKANFWQRGEALDYTNNTAATLEANTVVVIGKRIGVIGTDIAPGTLGTVHVSSVFEMNKAAEVVTFGDTLYWDEGNACLTTTAGDVIAGYATSDAAAGDSTVRVKLLG